MAVEIVNTLLSKIQAWRNDSRRTTPILGRLPDDVRSQIWSESPTTIRAKLHLINEQLKLNGMQPLTHLEWKDAIDANSLIQSKRNENLQH